VVCAPGAIRTHTGRVLNGHTKQVLTCFDVPIWPFLGVNREPTRLYKIVDRMPSLIVASAARLWPPLLSCAQTSEPWVRTVIDPPPGAEVIPQLVTRAPLLGRRGRRPGVKTIPGLSRGRLR
jgi:hypothetical protein